MKQAAKPIVHATIIVNVSFSTTMNQWLPEMTKISWDFAPTTTSVSSAFKISSQSTHSVTRSHCFASTVPTPLWTPCSGRVGWNVQGGGEELGERQTVAFSATTAVPLVLPTLHVPTYHTSFCYWWMLVNGMGLTHTGLRLSGVGWEHRFTFRRDKRVFPRLGRIFFQDWAVLLKETRWIVTAKHSTVFIYHPFSHVVCYVPIPLGESSHGLVCSRWEVGFHQVFR